MTRLCSERNERADLLDLLLLVDLLDLVDLALLTLFRVDWRSRRFLLMVRCRFLFDEEAADVVNHECLRASEAVILALGSRINSLSMKSLASADTSFQYYKIQKDHTLRLKQIHLILIIVDFLQ